MFIVVQGDLKGFGSSGVVCVAAVDLKSRRDWEMLCFSMKKDLLERNDTDSKRPV